MKITAAYRSEAAASYEAEDCSASHGDDTVNATVGGHSRRWQTRPGRAGVLAVTAGIVLLVTACGSGSSGTATSRSMADPSSASSSSSTRSSSSTTVQSAGSVGSSNSGGSGQAQQNLAFARCMRSGGVTDFPDPGPNGQFGTILTQLENSPRFGTAYNACKHLLPDRGVSKAQQDGPQLLKFAKCMHAHGVPSYPESGPASPYSSISNTAVNELRDLGPGVNPNSPVVQRAVQTCERLNPVGS